jgi:hypothetical protein
MVILFTAPVAAQSAADSAAIIAPALDYIEGWERADTSRMARGLFPNLTKVGVMEMNGRLELMTMDKAHLVRNTGLPRPSDPAFDGRGRARILDIFQDIATVRVSFDGWVDHVQVARIDGEWKIVNVLWQPRRR